MKTLVWCVLALTAIFTSSVFAAELKPEEFLLKLGYLKEKAGSNRGENPTPEEMKTAVLKYQKFTGLTETGIIDKETEKAMKAPRCGVKDIHDGFAEYKLFSKWPTNILTWKITKYSANSRLSRAQQYYAIKRGLERWAKVTPLIFQETGGKADINISFERWVHGDNYPFDGKGRFLAHAAFPTNGLTHFDDDEIWINGKSGGTDLETVAAHEFGHALGLDHSAYRKALMAPTYQIFPDNFKFHWDDIAGIQALYGRKSSRVTPSTPRPTTPTTTTPRRTTPRRTTPRTTTTTRRTITNRPTGGSGFCNHLYGNIDAVMSISGNDFVFVDNRYVIDGRSGHKMEIASLFPGGPNMVQAAVYSERVQKAYLFSNQNVWAYSLDSAGRFRLNKNFPKYISNTYSHNPETVMRFSYGDERLFLIKNGFIMEFDPYHESVTPGIGYRARDFFINIPYEIDATIATTDEVYFISKKKAYRMSNRNHRVEIQGKPVNLVFNKCRN